MSAPSRSRRRRAALIPALLCVLAAAGAPAAAAAEEPPLGPDPAPVVNAARTAVQEAQSHAAVEQTALLTAQQDLTLAADRLAELRRQVAELDGQVAGDTAEVARVTAQMEDNRQRLHNFVRNAYENGPNSAFIYIMAAGSFPEAIQRKAEVDRLGDAGTALVQRIAAEQADAERLLAESRRDREQAVVAREQAVTAENVVAVQVDHVQAAKLAAEQTLAQSNVQLAGAVQAKQAWDTEQAARAARAAAAARAEAERRAADLRGGPPEPGVVYGPVATSTFTVDTDLTLPSGETADRLNGFLAGSALAGLGDAFMAAERDHHTSARYLVAHAIEESSFGTSQIARDKHNLFGFGADDAHPYRDAVTFSSFQACIDYVSGYIYRHYLVPGGSFYHGPTLRGMNVDYASDPHWAANIARIARTIP